jgi:hypothetical protein
MTPERSGRARPRPSGRRGPARRSEPARTGWTGRRTNWLRRRPDGPDLSARKKEGRPPRPTSREGGRQAVVPVAGQRRCLGPNRHPGPRPTQPRQRQQPPRNHRRNQPTHRPNDRSEGGTDRGRAPNRAAARPVRSDQPPAPGGGRPSPTRLRAQPPEGSVAHRRVRFPRPSTGPQRPLTTGLKGPGGDLAGARPGGPGR